MIGLVLFCSGAVLALEGLLLALAPARVEDVLSALARLAPEARRVVGLAALAGGVILLALGRLAGF